MSYVGRLGGLNCWSPWASVGWCSNVTAMGIPAGCVGVIVIDTPTLSVSVPQGVKVDLVVGTVMVLVMVVVAVVALLLWIVQHRDVLGKL